ncbi:T9SS type A sorting domain-containing protein [candidate division KSB1 bacterium]|nr:T9SS type A sorting domain-containing protein [candidate division KSB1 bacterium]
MRKGLLLLVVLITCTAFAGENLISLSSGSGAPGSKNNIVTLSVQNADSIRGISLSVTDMTPYITVDTARTVEGTNPILFKFNYINETFKVVLLQNKYQLILPNKGALIYISYSVAENAPENQTFKLDFEEVTVSDINNQKLDFTTESSNFEIKSATGIRTGENQNVLTYQLTQNYPNPFNPQTRIEYTIPTAQTVLLTIFNPLGQKVRELVNRTVPEGNHTAFWNGLNDQGLQVPAGVYIYRIKAGEFEDSKMLTLIR